MELFVYLIGFKHFMLQVYNKLLIEYRAFAPLKTLPSSNSTEWARIGDLFKQLGSNSKFTGFNSTDQLFLKYLFNVFHKLSYILKFELFEFGHAFSFCTIRWPYMVTCCMWAGGCWFWLVVSLFISDGEDALSFTVSSLTLIGLILFITYTVRHSHYVNWD